MIHLLGLVCFFSNLGCTQPVLVGHPFDTMKACNDFKGKIAAVVKPADWIDAKLECVEDKEVF